MRLQLQLRTLKVLARIEHVLNGVKTGVLLDYGRHVVEALKRRRRAARLQDHSTLGDEERALAEDVGVHLAIPNARDDFAFHDTKHRFQLVSVV